MRKYAAATRSATLAFAIVSGAFTHAADLSLEATLIQQPRTSSKALKTYYVHAILTNRSGAAITLYMMSCSWWDSWKFSAKAEFDVFAGSCPKNSLARWDLEPNEAIEFDFWIGPRSQTADVGDRITMGFAPINKRTINAAFNSANPLYLEEERIWTDEIVLPSVVPGQFGPPIKERIQKRPPRTFKPEVR